MPPGNLIWRPERRGDVYKRQVVRYNSIDFDYNEVIFNEDLFRDTKGELTHNDVTILIAKLTAILRLANAMDLSLIHIWPAAGLQRGGQPADRGERGR